MAFLGFLFGPKYNKKIFTKNTADFKDQIQRLWEKCRGIPGAGVALNQILLNLDGGSEYPAATLNKKDMIEIDARITRLLGLMWKDLQRGSSASLSAHAGMVLKAVKEARAYGEEKESPMVLKGDEQTVDLLARIEDTITKQLTCKQKKDEIFEEIRGLAQDDPKRSLLKTKYDIADAELKMHSNVLLELKASLNSHIKATYLDQEAEAFDALPDPVITPEYLSERAAMLSDRRAIRIEAREAIGTIVESADEEREEAYANDPGITEESSELDARLAAAEATEVGGDISSTTPPVGAPQGSGQRFNANHN